MARSRRVSFEKNTSDKMVTSVNNKSNKKTTMDKDLEVNKFFTPRITKLDHFEGTIEGIRRTLMGKPHLEEQFKASAFGQIVYEV